MLGLIAALLQAALAAFWLAFPLLGAPLGRSWSLNFTETIRLQLISCSAALFLLSFFAFVGLRIVPNWFIILLTLLCNAGAGVALFFSHAPVCLVITATFVSMAGVLNFVLALRLLTKHHPSWTVEQRVLVLMLAFNVALAAILIIFSFVDNLHYVFMSIVVPATICSVLIYAEFLRAPFVLVESIQDEEHLPIHIRDASLVDEEEEEEYQRQRPRSYWLGLIAVFFSYGPLLTQIIVAAADHETFASRLIAMVAFALGTVALMLPKSWQRHLQLWLLVPAVSLIILPHWMQEDFALAIFAMVAFAFSLLLNRLLTSGFNFLLTGERQRNFAYLLSAAFSTLVAGFAAAIFVVQGTTYLIYFSLMGASMLVGLLFAYLV